MVTPEAENGEDPQLQTVVTLAGLGSATTSAARTLPATTW